ncbi:uncharacterized protein LOC143556652 isoform X2 [Bidens hawaiensis]|uniref:uncharacterized protein LOC143556652 isoform X2 n=1 Tax=Bidens hawaiensis TaxID=980011 RepID=UPI00404A39C2
MAAVSLLDTMAQNNTTDDDVKPTILHDFLGRECPPATKLADAAGCSSVSGAGGRPASTASDLGSVGTFYEGVPFFGQKTDFSGSKIQFSGSKRSLSDSGFVLPSRSDGNISQPRPGLPETSHLMKMLRHVGADRPRWAHEDEPIMGVHQMRSTPSHMVQPANASKWDRAIPVNVGPVLQYPSRAGPYGYQPVSNRFKDSNPGPPLISQSAADEGSRTGIKGSGILSTVAEPSSSKLKSLISNTEPNASTPPSRQGSSSVSRQMTIFYGGQAHVFDDVHPNKADVIMALAGSNGGSWSTSFLPKPSVGEAIPLSGGQSIISMKDGREQKSEDGRYSWLNE